MTSELEYNSNLIRKVRDIINDECITRVPSGSKELLALGGKSYYTWQFYLRRALHDPSCLQLIGNDFWNKNEEIFKQKPFQIAGVESAALPLITTIVIEGANRGHNINAFSIRKNRKEYGKKNLIEGIPTSDEILFVDDLTSPQHNTFWHAVNALSLERLTLNGIGYVLVLKKKEGETRMIETSLGSVTIQSLFTLSDFALTLDDYNSEKTKISI